MRWLIAIALGLWALLEIGAFLALEDEEPWICVRCDHTNLDEDLNCTLCGEPRPIDDDSDE